MRISCVFIWTSFKLIKSILVLLVSKAQNRGLYGHDLIEIIININKNVFIKLKFRLRVQPKHPLQPQQRLSQQTLRVRFAKTVATATFLYLHFACAYASIADQTVKFVKINPLF